MKPQSKGVPLAQSYDLKKLKRDLRNARQSCQDRLRLKQERFLVKSTPTSLSAFMPEGTMQPTEPVTERAPHIGKTRTKKGRRDYMKQYMREYRAKQKKVPK